MADVGEKTYTYYAFISYNHRDERIAKWVQYSLEHYRLPSIARREIGEDVSLRPVFRYVSDLGVGVLRDALKAELETSRFLLVICSPHSAKPNVKGEHWVNDEIRHFVSLGRADRIIPVIVDGEVGGGERECFPPALRESGIVGVDMTKENRKIVIQKVVAKLLGLKPDILIDRYREECRRMRRRWFLGFLTLAAMVVLGCAFAWDCSRTVSWDYADYVDSWGLPQGIFPLSDEQVAHRHLHYRFEYRGYRLKKSIHADSSGWSPGRLFGLERTLVRVVQANSTGYPCAASHTEYAARPVIQEFEYDMKDGLARVDTVKYCAFNGDGRPPRLLKRLKLSTVRGVVNGQIDFKGEDDSVTLYGDASATSVSSWNQNISEQSRTRIARHNILRDARGRTKSVRFLSAEGTPRADGDGIYGFDYDIDAETGRIMSRWFIGQDGKRHPNKIGVAGVVYTYEGRNMKSTTYANPSSTPTVGPHGWAVCMDDFDKWDNNVASHYKNAKGEPTPTKEGVSNTIMTFDEHGNLVSLRCYGSDEKPTLCADGNFGWNAEYDTHGRQTRFALVGLDEQLVSAKKGFAETRFEYDECGHAVGASYYGTNGEPVFDTNGISSMRSTYDSRGNMTSMRFYGTDGMPALSKEGIAGWDSEYDAGGRETRRVSLGIDGKPTVCADGYSEVRFKYDSRGNQTSQRYYDESGHPTFHKDGNAGLMAEYDDAGHLKRFVSIGIDGKPVRPRNGNTEIRRKYDACGNCIEEANFDADGRPDFNADRVAVVRNEFDSEGNATRCRFFGPDGNLTLNSEGQAGWDAEYDGFGRMVRAVNVGLDGRPATTMPDGLPVELRSDYDDRGNHVSVRFLDASGNPMLAMDGTAGWNAEYDNCGRVTRQMFIGKTGSPVPVKGKGLSSEIRRKYDTCGNCTEVSHHDTGGSLASVEGLVAMYRDLHDSRGNVTNRLFFGTDGKATFHSYGHAGWNAEYDSCGHMTRYVSLGLDGLPMAIESGQVEIRRKFDSRGNCTEESYHDKHGMLVKTKTNVAMVRNTYDAHGNTVSRRFFGTDGKLTLHADGNAGWDAEYDDRGNQMSCIYLGIDGQPTLNKTGIAYERAEFNGRNQPVKVRRYGVSGQLVADSDGFCGVNIEYDANGVKIAQYGIILNGERVRQRPVVTFSETFPDCPARRHGLTEMEWILVSVNEWQHDFVPDDEYCTNFQAALADAYGRRSVWRFRRIDPDADPSIVEIRTNPNQPLGVRLVDKWLPEAEVRKLFPRTGQEIDPSKEMVQIASPASEK